jgi:hypothetical protein
MKIERLKVENIFEIQEIINILENRPDLLKIFYYLLNITNTKLNNERRI